MTTETTEANPVDSAPASDSAAATELTQASGTEATTTTTTAAERPEWLPETYWKDGAPDQESVRAAFFELDSLRAARGEVPADAASYQLPTLDEALTAEVGEFLADDPLMSEFREHALKAGWPQGQFGETLTFFARAEAALAKSAEAAATKEREVSVAAFREATDKALGAKAAERKTAVSDWLKAQGGPVEQIPVTPETVAFLEKQMAHQRGDASGAFSGSIKGDLTDKFGADRLAAIRAAQ